MAERSADETIETARRMGLEADAEEARQWMLAVAATEAAESDRIAADLDAGIFGDRVSLLDFDPDDLEHFRGLVPQVRVQPHPQIQSAISIAGSAAQGKIQLFPGDCDYFERVHVRASTEQEAAQVFREAFRATALRAVSEPDIVLLEADLGAYPEAVVQRGTAVDAGHTIEWTTPEIIAGEIMVEAPDGSPRTYRWDDCDVGGGWLYLYWIVADRERGRISIASNVIDLSWEDDDGVIRSLDGAVDPLVQEVYLEPEALPLVERLQRLIQPGAREAYQEAMKEQVHHYSTEEQSFGKVAKRLYNLCRVTDELEAAAYVRELFDEPSAGLYQVSGLLEAADAALDPDSGIDRETVLQQLDVLAATIDAATDGEEERQLLGALGELREAAIGAGKDDEDWGPMVAQVRSQAAEVVNEFFRTRLLAHARVKEILDSLTPQ